MSYNNRKNNIQGSKTLAKRLAQQSPDVENIENQKECAKYLPRLVVTWSLDLTVRKLKCEATSNNDDNIITNISSIIQ